ncbi:nuclear transport factor 2 family protein [Variovorax paradoxus]|uniref:nuclear transport factor 2 family protein n=1 Tax=Variovorax paradoxus TaxID=34073 RepID=UPI0027D8088E|nr:nuclear transport factor 2 family protein [Variovorax paradoxus]
MKAYKRAARPTLLLVGIAPPVMKTARRVPSKEFAMPEQNKTVLLKANAAISKLDFEGFLKFCTDDVKWTMVGEQTIDGKEAVRSWMKETYVEAPDFDAKTLIAEGDWLAALGEISIKDQDGSVTRSSYCDIWRFRDGKMAELKAYVVEAKP